MKRFTVFIHDKKNDTTKKLHVDQRIITLILDALKQKVLK